MPPARSRVNRRECRANARKAWKYLKNMGDKGWWRRVSLRDRLPHPRRSCSGNVWFSTAVSKGRRVSTVTAEAGIFSDAMIEGLIASDAIRLPMPLAEGQVQPASLDLRLGKRCWRMRASFLPGQGGSVTERIDAYSLHEIDLSGGAVLETGCVYIAEILEGLALPTDISATANPKSSTLRCRFRAPRLC